MQEKELKLVLQEGEGYKIEFKKSLADTNRIVEIVCSFANSKGGIIYVGVDNKGKIIGIEIGKQKIEQLTNAITDNTEPVIYPEIKVIKIKNKNVILIKIKESKNKPHTAYGKPFIRVEKNTKFMKQSKYEELLLERSKHKLLFDIDICEGTTLKDIDKEKVKWYLEEREKERNISKKIKISFKNLLQNLKALKGNKPTNAGILFFGTYPQKFLPNARLRVVKFKGTKVIHPTLDTANCEGTVWEMINTAEDFIRKNIRLLGIRTEKSFRREDKFEYPIKALREAIINALIHRNYFETGDVRVFIFDNRVEIINPGSFPKGVTPKNPKHIPVNEILCNLVYDVGYIEKYGSGIYMMGELSKRWGNKEPYYELHPIETKIIFESPVKEPTFVEIEIELSSRQKKAIEYVKRKSAITNKEYRKINSISKRISLMELNQLVKKNILVRKGRGRSVYYVFR